MTAATTPPSIAEVHALLTAPGAPFEMEARLVRGAETRTWKNAPLTLTDVLEASKANGDKTFLVYEDQRISFDEHYRAVMQLADQLINRFGVRQGDRVAIAMRNYPEWSVAFFAAAVAGAVVTPLNAWWQTHELEYGLTDSGARVLFCDAERLDRMESFIPHLPSLAATIVVHDDRPALAAGALHYNDVLGEVPIEAPPVLVPIDSDDEVTIFYSSGTTGQPKGVLGTHRNICSNLLSLAFSAARAALRSTSSDSAASAATRTSGQNAYLLSVPFFHVTGCHSVLVSNLHYGGKIVIMHKWDPARALELIERERITTFGGVPAMVWQVLDHPDFATRDISSIKAVAYGGAPAAPELVRRIEEMFPGRTPSNGYGLTETSSVSTMNSGDDYLRKPNSVGVAIAVCDVKVVGPEGETLGIGDVGELWIKGPNVVKGYFNKPEATAASFTDGWLHSGDIARIDDEGFVYIVDRAKDIIIRGGENVYCVEVEAALYEHPAVSDAAVIGIPHTVLGEEVGAVVHCPKGIAAPTQAELIAWVAERLAGFKVPVKVWFKDEPLERNAAGKILKRELKTELFG